MALRGNFVGAANQPGIIGRTIFLELLEKFIQAGVQQPLGAIAIEMQRQIG
jgi:hypothetical protein